MPAKFIAPASMRTEEYARLEALLDDLKPARTLEIGMANGGSSVVICRALRAAGGSQHTAVDPFQSAPQGWGGRGIQAVHAAGYADLLEVLEEPDYLALPRLVSQRRIYDFILIDGWHSFDYTLLDVFYADLLLRPGGILAIHDTGWPAVYKAVRFLESHKPYQRIGPPIAVELPRLGAKIARRLGQFRRGLSSYREARSRRTEWFSLGAYRKEKDHQVGDDFFAQF